MEKQMEDGVAAGAQCGGPTTVEVQSWN